MNGINLDGINNAINKNNGYYEFVDADVKRMITVIKELNNLYSGVDLNFLFQDLVAQTNNVNMISAVVKNYSELLKTVVTSYKAQDLNLKSQVNHIISKTNM